MNNFVILAEKVKKKNLIKSGSAEGTKGGSHSLKLHCCRHMKTEMFAQTTET